jgi:hypothetical protein
MAYQDNFSYFTNISHHKWSYYNLTNLNGRKSIKSLGKEMLKRDTKENRLISNIVFPDEAENILSRAIQSYEPIRRNQYLLKTPKIQDPDMLRTTIKSHALAFNKNLFLSKSPFNSFRIPQLASIFGDKAYFIHIHRNGYATSESIFKNGFKYFLPQDSTDDPALFWARHIEAIINSQKGKNVFTLSFENLVSDPSTMLEKIWDWLSLPKQAFEYETKYKKDDRESTIQNTKSNHLIEQYNKLLGYLPKK